MWRPAPSQVTSLLGAWGGGSLPAAATDAITIAAGSGVTPPPADGSGQKILPQLAFGGGWYTALYFTNTTASPVSFPVSFIGDDGAPLTVPSVGGSSTTVNLAARGTALIEALNNGALSTGYVSATLPAGVTGYGVFRQGAIGAGAQEAVVPLSSASSTVSTLIWDDTDSVTAVAIVNPSSVTTVVTITVRDTTGSVIGTSSVTLPANNKAAVGSAKPSRPGRDRGEARLRRFHGEHRQRGRVGASLQRDRLYVDSYNGSLSRLRGCLAR